MIRNLIRISQKKGVPKNRVSHWIHRTYGDMTVYRYLSTGELGMSFPCVMCRKELERKNIQWNAHLGDKWFNSRYPEELPISKPTTRQCRMLFNRKP